MVPNVTSKESSASIDAKSYATQADNAHKSLALLKYGSIANVDFVTSQWFAVLDKRLRLTLNAQSNVRDVRET